MYAPRRRRLRWWIAGTGVAIVLVVAALWFVVRTGLAAVATARALAPQAFAWRADAYEFVAGTPAFDLLAGTDGVRLALEAGAPFVEVAKLLDDAAEPFFERRRPYLLYA